MTTLKHLYAASIALACLVSLVGCKNKTFEAPSEKTPLRRIDADTPVQGLFADSVNQYAFKLAASPTVQDSEGNLLLSPTNLYVSNLVLLNAASATTYQALEAHLGVLSPDYSPLNIEANQWLTSPKNQEELRLHTGIFMVWPIRTERAFATRMAETLGADILKLGAASLASQEALDLWVQRTTGRKITLNRPLDRRRDVILTLHTATLDIKLPGSPSGFQRASNPNRTMHVASLQDQGLELVWFETQTETPAFPTYQEFQTLLNDLKPSESTETPSIAQESTLDLEPLYRETGLASLIDGPNDLRYMALEINGAYPIAQNHHYARITTIGSQLEEKKRLPFLIRERESGLILFLGMSPE